MLVDEDELYFKMNPVVNKGNVRTAELPFNSYTDFTSILEGVDIVYHLISTISPSSSNVNIGKELQENVAITVNILESCIKNKVKMIVFLSSGGTIYGKGICPFDELAETNPINTYGIQKLTIEKTIYLYNYLYEIDYRIVRLSNPYGPYQRPNGKLGAITTFSYKAIQDEQIDVYGDGTVIRDYIYIDDAIEAIINISTKKTHYKIYNVGSGSGYSLSDVLTIIQEVLGKNVKICYKDHRKVDLKTNYLDVGRYKSEFGEIQKNTIYEGILKTINFLKSKKGDQL